MIPRTKRQKEVFALSQKLKPLTLSQATLLAKRAFKGVGVIEQNKIWCVEGNHIFKIDNKDVNKSHYKCPICGKRLELTSGIVKQKFVAYGTKLDVAGRYQVIREFTITHRHKSWSVDENMQSWISEDGKETIISRPMKFMPRYIDDWDFNKPMSIRQISRACDWYGNSRYDICAYDILPRPKLQNFIKRAGYKVGKHTIPLNKLFKLILTYPMYETLLKAGKNEAIKFYAKSNKSGERWAQIKLCIRHNYEPYDWGIWNDYIVALQRLGIDTHNPKFVCPADLKDAHDKAMDKLHKIEQKKELEKRREEIAKAEKAFAKKIAPFLGISIEDGNCTITPLKSVQEFFEEGTAMHHCVFTNKYYEHKDCLILSAKVDGKRAETAEIKVSTGEIVQCRGKCNKNSEHHEMILSLLNQNIKQICKCSKYV